MPVVLKVAVTLEAHLENHAQRRGRIDFEPPPQFPNAEQHIRSGIFQHWPDEFLPLAAPPFHSRKLRGCLLLPSIGAPCHGPEHHAFRPALSTKRIRTASAD